MNYDVSPLLAGSSCRVVFAGDPETAKAIEAGLLEKEPKYISGITPAFAAQKKFGPFTVKNKACLWDILVKTEGAQEIGKEYLQKHTKDLDLFYYLSRIPAGLNADLLRRASVLYDALCGKKHFILNDHNGSNPENSYAIASWMLRCDLFEWVPCNVIWITDLSLETLLEQLGTTNQDPSLYAFFAVREHRIDPIGKGKFEEDYKRRQHAQKVFEEAKAFDMFSMINPRYDPRKDNREKAVALYQIAAEEGHPGAQFALGFLYCMIYPDTEKAVFWLAKAVFNPEYNEKTASPLLKDCHKRAVMHLQQVVSGAKGKELLRRQIGAKAEAFIREAQQAEAQKASANAEEAKIKAAVAALRQSDDTEWVGRSIKRIMQDED